MQHIFSMGGSRPSHGRRQVLPAPVVHPVFLVLLTCFWAALPDSAHGQCLESSIECLGVTTSSSDSTLQVACTNSSGFFRLPQGRIGGQVQGVGCQCIEGHVETAARDVFEITGVPGSGSIPCTIRLRFTGSLARPQVNGGAFLFAGVVFSQLEKTAQAPGAWDGWWPDLDESIDLDVVIDGNTPFSLTYWATITSFSTLDTSRFEAQLTFLGLPDGARVTSCQGFSQVGVAVENWTWARVKSLYR